MASKRDNYTSRKRRLKKREKQRDLETAPYRDKTLGRACRRKYGAGEI